MKKACLILVLCLLVMLPCCKKKLPTQADIPTKVLPTIELFTASPTSIKLDEFSTLSWSIKNATNITIDHGVGTVSATGTKEVSPTETTTYTLTATNSEGEARKSLTLEVIIPDPTPPIIEYFTFTYLTTDDPGAFIVLSWSTTNTTYVSIIRDDGQSRHTGEPVETWTTTQKIFETTTFELWAYNDSGSGRVGATVTVNIVDRSNVELASYWTSNEPASIYGYVKNTGNIPVFHVYIKVTDDDYGRCETEISGWIMPGEEAHFGAQRVPLRWTWTGVHLNMPPEITWELR